MHVRGDLNCTRGYEWGILASAKQRNPAIRTYGLACVCSPLTKHALVCPAHLHFPDFKTKLRKVGIFLGIFSHPHSHTSNTTSLLRRWGVPGWIGDMGNTNNPGSYYTQDNIDYHMAWLDCALNTWGIEIDYMGVWCVCGGGALALV